MLGLLDGLLLDVFFVVVFLAFFFWLQSDLFAGFREVLGNFQLTQTTRPA